MSCLAAVRSVGRSAGRAVSASRLAGKSKPSRSPFSVPKNRLSSPSSFRSVMEMSRCVDSMLPFHSATASSLLISRLSLFFVGLLKGSRAVMIALACQRLQCYNPMIEPE